jgi:hypothetical protein
LRAKRDDAGAASAFLPQPVALTVMTRVFAFLKSRELYLGLCRYGLGLTMIPYAVSKLVQLQFVVLPLHTWQLPLEQLPTPMLAWAFLGHAGWFQVLLGVFELVPALLLLFRRTTLLGAMLLLPVTLNVMLINEAFALWPDTRLTAQVLLLNVGVLVFEWRSIQAILRTIWQRERTYRLTGWETGINLLLVAAMVGLIGSQLLGYARESDELTGDWHHRHPNEWVLQPEPAHPVDRQRSYFGTYGSYEEAGPAGLNQRLNWYQLDRQKHQLHLGPRPDSVAQTYSYTLVGDSVLTLQPLTGSAGIRVLKRRILNTGAR